MEDRRRALRGKKEQGTVMTYYITESIASYQKYIYKYFTICSDTNR